jgi:hypothetical protein
MTVARLFVDGYCDRPGDSGSAPRFEEVRSMAVRLNQTAFDQAKTLIREGKFVADERDAWSEHQPSAEQENRFIEEHGFPAYTRWHLGVDDEENEDTKAHYKFPYGDFHQVHRCGVLAAESRAGQGKYYDIELATAHLHGMLDALMSREGNSVAVS